MKKYHTFTLNDDEQVQHFLKFREMYDPPMAFKLFDCKTEIYHDPDDGNSYVRTVVDVYVRDEYEPAPVEEMPGLPKDQGPDPVS